MAKVDTTYIPKWTNNVKKVKHKFNTQDIINSILRMDNYKDKDFCKFAKQFEGRGGLKKLWRFVKYDIAYQKDDFKSSLQKNPAALWHYKKGDCKSKTLFINAVLRCLKIPYIVRFTNYNQNDTEVRHVYTVALIDGKELPIDSVYHFFGQEKPYFKKIDYKMEGLYEISGIGDQPQDTKLPTDIQAQQTANKPQYVPSHKIPLNQPNRAKYLRPICPSAKNVAKVEEIKQKQQYVEKPEPIEFSKLDEGKAMIKIAIRELEIIKVMRPEVARVCTKGIDMLRRAEKGDYCPTGDIPKSLAGTYNKIKAAERLQGVKANSHGILAKRIEALKALRKKSVAGVGAMNYPAMICANRLFVEQDYNYQSMSWIPGTFKPADALDSNVSNCANTSNMVQFVNANPNLIPSTGAMMTYKEVYDHLYYIYGHESDYRVSVMEWPNFSNDLKRAQTEGIVSFVDNDDRVMVNSQTELDLLTDYLNANSGVLDKYLNDVFAANPIDTPKGTAGSGLMYSFSDGMTYGGASLNPNELPPSVISKMGFHNSYLDAANMFSNVSRSNIKGLARNGVLFDNGGVQPETTLNTLQGYYMGGTPPGINDFGISAAVIAAIATAVVSIIGAIAGAVEQCSRGEDQASRIDRAAADTARFSTLGASLMPEQDDFYPRFKNIADKVPGGSFGLMAGAGLLFFLATQEKK